MASPRWLQLSQPGTCVPFTRSADNGEWRTGWELTYLVDPLARKRFGGTARELETIGAYQSALESIEKIKKPKDEDGTPWWEKAKAKKEAAQGKPEPK